MLYLQLGPRLGWLGRRDPDGFQIEVGIDPGQALYRDAAHSDLFHQLLVVGVDGIEPIHLVVLGLVGGGVAQDHQRVEFRELLGGRLALHLLRFIQDQDRTVFPDDIDGPAGLELIQLQINAPGIFAASIERLHVDDHHIDAGVRGKALQIMELLRVIDEVTDALAVLLQKMLGHDLERLQDAFANGDARHHNDELAPAIVSI